MNFKFKKISQKENESDPQLYQIHRKEKSNNSTTFRSLRYWIAIISLLFINYHLFSNYIVLNLRNDLLLKNDYWLAMQKQDRKSCLKKSAFNQSTLDTLNEIINFFNKKQDFNYFMCFSSLYYAVKVESYDVFSSQIDQNSFDYKNYFYSNKNGQKCVSKEFCVSEKSPKKTRLHLCYLNTFLKEKFLCDVVKNFDKMYSRDTACDYNHMTGEYIVMFSEEIEIIFHEYHLELDSLKFLTDSFYSKRNKTGLDVELFEENAKLNQGWLGKFFANQYFSLPRHFFYSKLYTIKFRELFRRSYQTAIRNNQLFYDILFDNMFIPNLFEDEFVDIDEITELNCNKHFYFANDDPIYLGILHLVDSKNNDFDDYKDSTNDESLFGSLNGSHKLAKI
ncbi:hypothetical protein BpHYR1_013033 [Brachionus plicatilis]|uniref:Uncharacterized protein n=1 Tax=Brachionus plicatilis TaxID=10195 RepID=A0A3M7SIE7_BRAPC|nr:hypothetical protein BpHYR1_013033 [Brachionus plicatilis]